MRFRAPNERKENKRICVWITTHFLCERMTHGEIMGKGAEMRGSPGDLWHENRTLAERWKCASRRIISWWMENAFKLSFVLLLNGCLRCNFMLQWRKPRSNLEIPFSFFFKTFIAMVSLNLVCFFILNAHIMQKFVSCDFCLINNSRLQAHRAKTRRRKKRPSRIVQ